MDILNKEFDKRFRGYDEEQVSHYLDTVATELDQVIKENSELKQQLEAAKDKLKYFEQLQDSLNNSIIVAHEAADRLKQNARKEAELILYEADQEAARLVSEATAQSKQIEANNELLRRNGQELHKQLRYLLTSQLDALDSMRNSELLQPIELKFSTIAMSGPQETVQPPVSEQSAVVEDTKVEEVTFEEAEELVLPEKEIKLENVPEMSATEEGAGDAVDESNFFMQTSELQVIDTDNLPKEAKKSTKSAQGTPAKKATKKDKQSKKNVPSYDTEDRYIPVPRLEEFDTADFSALLNEAFEKEQAAAGASNVHSVRGRTINIDLPK